MRGFGGFLMPYANPNTNQIAANNLVATLTERKTDCTNIYLVWFGNLK